LRTLKLCRLLLIDRDFDIDRIVIESVIRWGTGAVGAEIITAILDHRSDLDLVGAKAYSEAKHGKDIGTLVGRDPVGVLATADSA
jgi:hypothetical protein